MYHTKSEDQIKFQGKNNNNNNYNKNTRAHVLMQLLDASWTVQG